MSWGAAVHETREGVSIAVRVSPRASRTRFMGAAGEGPETALKIALAAPPVEGRANEALISYLARRAQRAAVCRRSDCRWAFTKQDRAREGSQRMTQVREPHSSLTRRPNSRKLSGA